MTYLLNKISNFPNKTQVKNTKKIIIFITQLFKQNIFKKIEIKENLFSKPT